MKPITGNRIQPGWVKHMPLNKIVARYTDGRMVKGSTQNFDIASGSFHVNPDPAANGSGGTQVLTVSKTAEVHLCHLKAVFFVTDYQGSPTYDELKAFSPNSPSGRRVKVIFKDGEELVGATLNYDPGALGFFVFPADPASNNRRVFVINAAVRNIVEA